MKYRSVANLFPKLQYFLIRRTGVAVKKQWVDWTSLKLFHPNARLHFGNWLPSGAYKEIFVQHSYRPPVPLGEGARIIDGGANIGLSSLYFLANFPTARIEAYEASPAAFDLLQQTIRSLKLDPARYTLINKALHSSDDTINFFVLPHTASALNASISGRDSLDQLGEQIEVAAVDFRKILEKPIDFLKLDVEGHEYELLDLPEISPSTIRSMAVEFHDLQQNRDEFVSLVSRFRDQGYRVESVEGNEISLLDDKLFCDEIIIKIFVS